MIFKRNFWEIDILIREPGMIGKFKKYESYTVGKLWKSIFLRRKWNHLAFPRKGYYRNTKGQSKGNLTKMLVIFI